MGGSGGVFSRETPEQVWDRIQRQQRELDPHFEIEVSNYLDTLLSRFNSRDTDGIQTHLEELKKALEKRLEDSLDLAFGGSTAKHTYVDGLSDVDALAFLGAADVTGQSPETVLADFARAIRERLPTTEVDTGRLAVTVKFSDGCEVQLLPATRAGDAYRIPAADGASWSRISPQTFAKELTRANKRAGDKLVPTIKLAKAISDSLPEERRLTGYHIEALAVAAFRDYSGAKNTKAMLGHFFEAAAERVTRPIADSTGQSAHVDDYLGAAESPQRLAASAELLRTARRIRNANGARSLTQWKALLGEIA